MSASSLTSAQRLAATGDAETHYQALLQQIRKTYPQAAQLCVAGIYSGGAWVAQRIASDLGLPEVGVVNIGFHRDDYAKKGLHLQASPTSIPWDLNGKTVLLVDDVLYTGRTVRAALNELFDYGRPAKVELAVLADRGERELPFQATFCGAQLQVPAGQSLVLQQAEAGQTFSWGLEARASANPASSQSTS